jgi:hypothetical protein
MTEISLLARTNMWSGEGIPPRPQRFHVGDMSARRRGEGKAPVRPAVSDVGDVADMLQV